MPHLDGFAVLEQLKSRIAAAYVPVLVLTADIMPEAKKKSARVGAKLFPPEAVRC